jgi:hypothetical protein
MSRLSDISMFIYASIGSALLLAIAAPVHASGRARTPGGLLRDAYTHVQVTVDGDIARTEVTQVFVNDLPSAAEATYGFPLPADAAVTGFAHWVDGKRIDARADDRDRASKIYERAAEDGHAARLNPAARQPPGRAALHADLERARRRAPLRLPRRSGRGRAADRARR